VGGWTRCRAVGVSSTGHDALAIVSFSFSDSSLRPVGYQRWRNLLFIHWPVPAAALRRLVPRQLDLDLYDGQAYLSLVPFLVAESRPRGIPRALATRFLETNLRTYVRAADGEAGIYFFSLDASSLLAVSAARLLYGLPYFPAVMSVRTEGPRTEYSSRRQGARDAQLDGTTCTSGAVGQSIAEGCVTAPIRSEKSPSSSYPRRCSARQASPRRSIRRCTTTRREST